MLPGLGAEKNTGSFAENTPTALWAPFPTLHVLLMSTPISRNQKTLFLLSPPPSNEHIPQILKVLTWLILN